MKNKHSKKRFRNYQSAHEAQASHYRAWKSGKKWLYGVGIATILFTSNEQTMIGFADLATVKSSLVSTSTAQDSLAANAVADSQASSIGASALTRGDSTDSQENMSSAAVAAPASSTASLDSSKLSQGSPDQSSAHAASSSSTAESSKDSSASSDSSKNSDSGSESTAPAVSASSQDLYAMPVINDVTSSNLNGFELPALNSLQQKSQGALIAEGLSLLGTIMPTQLSNGDGTKFNSLDLVNAVYEKVYGQKAATSMLGLEGNTTIHVTVKDAQPGDVLVWKNSQGVVTKVALYLGQGKFELLENGQVTIGSLSELSSDAAPVEALRLSQPALTTAGQDLLKKYAATESYQENQATDQFIATIADQARDLGQKYGVYASVMIAQAILESNSGTSQLSLAPDNNLFGIKGSFDGHSVTLPTQEDNGKGKLTTIKATFASYPDRTTSMMEYIHLIRNDAIYRGAWRENAKNYLQATAALTGKYATDIFYQQKLNSLIAVYHLTQYDSPKPTTTGNILPSTKYIPTEYREAMKFPAYDGVNYNISGSYPYGQCTYYVYNRVWQLGGKIGEKMGNGGDWGTNAVAQGYSTSAQPEAGDIVSFKPGVAGSSSEYGHVAFVEAVTNDGILVSEENAAGLGVLSYRVISNSELMNGVTFITPGK